MRSVLALAAAVAACVLPLAAATDPAILDVIVEIPGKQAPLGVRDFTVRDALGSLAVEAVELRAPDDRTSTAPDPLSIQSPDDETDAARKADRIVGIFLDELHLEESDGLAQARTSLAAFVRSRLGPRDLVAVLKPLASLTSIRLTADREEVAREIESARGRLGDYTPRTVFEQQFLAGTPERIDEARAQISLSALSALTAHIGRMPGARKTLIAVSDGFTVPRDSHRNVTPGFAGVTRTATIGRVALYPLHTTSSDAADASSGTAGTAAGSTKTREAAGSDESGRTALRRLADETTGFTIVAGPALSDDLGRVLRDASRYYLLKVSPRAGSDDGAFRAVTVSVDRRGAVVRARAGYSLAPTPESISRVRRPPPPLNVVRRTSPMIRPWFGLSSGGADRARVSFVWEPAARVPGVGARRSDPDTVSMQVTTLSGEPVFAGRIGSAGGGLVSTGQAPRLSFDSDAGRFLVQMEILDAGGRVLDRDVRDLVVNRFQTPVALGTPEVLRARTARELRPLLGGGAGVTAVAREFSRADHLVIRVPIIGEASELRATLTSGFGASLRELSVTRLASDPQVGQLDVALAGLATGSYVIRLNATSGDGHASDRVAFTVRP